MNTQDPNFQDISDQKQSTADNILEYFESYIKNYYSYKDLPVYKAIISFLIKYYVDIVYNIQPEKFKSLFERQVITNDLIDLLLISAGLPENLVQDLTLD